MNTYSTETHAEITSASIIQGKVTMKPKPTREEVLKYAKPLVCKFIAQHAQDIPKEQKDEIQQTAYLRLLEAYDGIDADAGWKSFVYNHCRGAVLDYLKFGKGHAEQKWSIAKPEEHGSRHVNKIRERVSLHNAEGEDVDLDFTLGANGIFTSMEHDKIEIKWDLIAKMSSIDDGLHAFAKYIRGFGIEEMAVVFGVSRARVGQMIAEFVARFDSPEHVDSPWFCQVIFALGLCSRLGLKDQDQSFRFGYTIGWNLNAIDLDSDLSYDFRHADQLELFKDQ